MPGHLRLTVLTPERVLLQVEQAAKVRLRLADHAWLSLYPNHAPLLAETAPGPVQYETEVEAGALHVGPGILWVSDNNVEILTSGLSGPDAAPDEAAEDSSFDRLARQLLTALSEPDATPET